MKKVPKERLTEPGQLWVCVACGRAREGDRYDMGDTSCVLWAVLCEAEKGCRCKGEPCPEPHWIAVDCPRNEEISARAGSDPTKDTSA